VVIVPSTFRLLQEDLRGNPVLSYYLSLLRFVPNLRRFLFRSVRTHPADAGFLRDFARPEEARELLEGDRMSAGARVLGSYLLVAVLGPMPAFADILVMKATDGRLLITNLGQRAGYTILSRHREFFGSSGMGLGSGRGGDPSKYEQAVRQTARLFALEPSLVKAVIRAESNFDPMATSPKGAMGLMQLMPDTARMHEVRNAYDPAENIHGGARHLRYLMDRYRGDLDLVLAAYNAGTKPVDRVRGIPGIPETREYVRRVHLFRARYRDAEAKLPKIGPMVARVDLSGKTLDQVYGVPIVLRPLPE
jgi:hypothetical protein